MYLLLYCSLIAWSSINAYLSTRYRVCYRARRRNINAPDNLPTRIILDWTSGFV